MQVVIVEGYLVLFVSYWLWGILVWKDITVWHVLAVTLEVERTVPCIKLLVRNREIPLDSVGQLRRGHG